MNHSPLKNRVLSVMITALALVFCSLSPLPAHVKFQSVHEVHPGEYREKRITKIARAVYLMDRTLYKEAEQVLLPLAGIDEPGNGEAGFLLGKIYHIEGAFDKAEEYLTRVAEKNPLLRDYALILLIDTYRSSGNYEKALATSRRVQSELLRQDAGKSAIEALFSLKKDREAVKELTDYVSNYPDDWDYKLMLGRLLEEQGKRDKAIGLYRNLYIHNAPVSGYAFARMKELKATSLNKKEQLKKADSQFKNFNYKKAEAAYQSLLKLYTEKGKRNILFKLGMSQFRQKKYTESARTFGLLSTPEALYWRARSFYRIDDREGFEKTKKELEQRSPGDTKLALLYIMEANEFRRKGLFTEADDTYRKVLTSYPDSAEQALWGLAWMHFTAADYSRSVEYFSRLTSLPHKGNQYKYLYWTASVKKKMYDGCLETGIVSGDITCEKANENFFKGLPFDDSYYGYLIRINAGINEVSDKIFPPVPVKPVGELYDRIETLMLLGMKEEAAKELSRSFGWGKQYDEYMYLSSRAMELEVYKRMIAFAESRAEQELLPYSYPRAYWPSINSAAEEESLDAYLIAALIREESRFDRNVRSWAGAIGLMQLMPATAKRMGRSAGVSFKGRFELHDSKKNITLGSHYLSKLLNEFKEIPLAVAAYNAGENRLRDWLTRFSSEDMSEFIENIPYLETRNYVKKVMKSYWQYRRINGLPIQGL